MIALHIIRAVAVLALVAFLGLLVWAALDAQRSAAICEDELGGTWTRVGCIVGDFEIIDDPTSIHSRPAGDDR